MWECMTIYLLNGCNRGVVDLHQYHYQYRYDNSHNHVYC